MAQKLDGRFELKDPVITEKDPGAILVTRQLPEGVLRSAFSKLDVARLTGTILDPRLDHQSGLVALVAGAEFFLKDHLVGHLQWRPAPNTFPDEVRRALKKAGVPEEIVQKLVRTIPAEAYFYIPKGANKVFELDTGVAVIDDFQRAINRLLVIGHQAAKTPFNDDGRLRAAQCRYQAAIHGYFEEVQRILFFKGGLLDSKIASVMPCSGRGVIVCDPTLKVTWVGIPKHIISLWTRNEQFREVYGLVGAESPSEVFRRMEGKPILIGRQPTHDCSNLFSMQLKPVDGTAVRFNPVVVNLFDGDFDGDTVHFYALLSKEGRADLGTVSIERLLEDCTPKRELAGIRLPDDPEMADIHVRKELNRFYLGDKLGFSIDLRDLLGTGGTGYFDDKRVHREDLRKVTIGMSEDTAWSEMCEAMLDFRLIKSGVAQAGGLANAWMALGSPVYCKLVAEGQEEDGRAMLRRIQVLKHILCQGMLSRKHGSREDAGDKSVLEELTAMFYRMSGCERSTKEEYLTYMVEEAGLPKECCQTVVDLFFQFGEPPEGIYKILERVNPAFMLTRNPANLRTLANLTGEYQPSWHDYFLRSRLNNGI